MTRREFLFTSLALTVPLRVPQTRIKPARVAIITDLHHGLAPDAMVRLRTFVEAVKSRKDLDAVLQLGDFCYSDAASKECLDLWRTIDLPTIHVLGNHDMDKCDKDAAMKAWGMPARYGAKTIGGYRFAWLDLNHYKKGGELVSYKDGNYFMAGATHNWADPEQLSWLARELKSAREPVIVLSHQPLGIRGADGKLPPEQEEVLSVLKGATAACLFGHLHVDRLETEYEIPCLCVNSASYFWSAGMHAYSKPLFAFAEFGTDGLLRIEGRAGEFVKPPPAGSDSVKGRSASIADRAIRVPKTSFSSSVFGISSYV